MYDMLMRPIKQFRDRWHFSLHRAPQLFTMALATLLAADLVHLGFALWGAGPAQPSPVIRRVDRPAVSGVDVQPIVTAHLFGVAPSGRNNPPEDAPVSGANLVLTGTMASADPAHGFAIIGEGGGPTKLYSVGDEISGAATLHAVYMDRAILNRGGSFETLVLRKALMAGRTAIVARSVVPPKPHNYFDSMGRAVDKPPGVLDQIMRMNFTDDDKARGLVVYAAKDGASFQALGLMPGDIVTAINGAALVNAQSSKDAFESLTASDAPTVTVMRQGRMLTLTLNVGTAVAQVANTAGGSSLPDLE